MTENNSNKARGRPVAFRLFSRPLTAREVQALISPDDVDAWFAAHRGNGHTRDEVLAACCAELGCSQATAREGWKRMFPREDGEERGGRWKRLNSDK